MAPTTRARHLSTAPPSLHALLPAGAVGAGIAALAVTAERAALGAHFRLLPVTASRLALCLIHVTWPVGGLIATRAIPLVEVGLVPPACARLFCPAFARLLLY